jgi:hypothetical protein
MGQRKRRKASMDDLNPNLPDQGLGDPSEVHADDAKPAIDRTRRAFLQGSARKLAYAAPLVLLFHPSQACASGGSNLSPAEPEGNAIDGQLQGDIAGLMG